MVPPASPLVARVADRIRAKIRRDAQPGARLPTEVELARQYDCSVWTVRGALNLLADEGLVQRRQGSGTYVSDRLLTRTGATRLLFRGSPEQLLYAAWARAALDGLLEEAALADRETRVVTVRPGRAIRRREMLSGDLLAEGLDSIILLEVFDNVLLQELGRRLPTVAMDQACYFDGVSSCALDHEQSMDAAVEHLWRLGHRRIGLTGHLNPRRADPAIQGRLDGFRKATETRDLPFNADWIGSEGDADYAVQYIRRWKDSSSADRPTAVICSNNHWTIAQAAIRLGVAVPAQLSIVALGDEGPWVEAVSRFQRRGQLLDVDQALIGPATDPMDPALQPLRLMSVCEVRLPFHEMGRWAMAEVMRRVEDTDARPEHKLFRGEIAPGNSVAPPTAPESTHASGMRGR
jgi:DNA-binding LacI/PurR family transcriptional regulator